MPDLLGRPDSGLEGHLAYQFLVEAGGTRLVQRETLRYKGLLRLFEPLIRVVLFRRLEERLEGIRADLESAWEVDAP